MKSRNFNVVWLIFYMVTITAIIVAMIHLQTTVVAQMSEQAEIDKWLAWKAEAGTKDKMQGSVLRRVPTSGEPPMLVLMRDYFGVIMTAVLAFYSLVFGFLWFIARGVTKNRTIRKVATEDTENTE